MRLSVTSRSISCYSHCLDVFLLLFSLVIDVALLSYISYHYLLSFLYNIPWYGACLSVIDLRLSVTSRSISCYSFLLLPWCFLTFILSCCYFYIASLHTCIITAIAIKLLQSTPRLRQIIIYWLKHYICSTYASF